MFFYLSIKRLCLYVVIVEMRGQYGYLSAIEWPLLPVSCYIVHLISVYLNISCEQVTCMLFIPR